MRWEHAFRRLRWIALPVALAFVGCGGGAHDQHAEHAHRSDDVHHRFEHADEWAKRFEGPERDAWQKPDAVVAALALPKNAVVADIGAGTGYFAVRFARVATDGKVLGLDVEPDMVRYMRERAAREGLANFVAEVVPPDDPKLPPGVDVVFVCDTVHHIDGRPAYFRKVAEKLAPKGRVVIVDFKQGDIPVGPPEHARVTVPQLDREMAEAGLRRVALDESTLSYQYVATYAHAE